ncbi:MAG: hypothetical protein AUG51_17945 [Acidobacteria bacterium 13_1_20CM_3_53_8]|nr:MAG: hypothetical protein AUG51_17945 [Acidobacteria bacterium 13_1_20CM_3_53_8]
MKYRFPVLALFYLLSSARVLLGQAAPAPNPTPVAERSHVERFSSPRMRDERAETEATKKLAANPNDTEALRTRAYARMGLQRYPEALEDLRRALAVEPNNATVKANYGYVLWKLGRRAEAVTQEREAVKLDEKNFTAQYQLGRFLMFSGGEQNLREAATHLRRALEIDPRQTEIRFDLLAVYRTLGDTAQAIAQLNLLQDSRPTDPRVVYVDALLASDRGDLNAAITGFRQALRQDPTLYGAKQDLGLALIKLKKWGEAEDVFADLAREQSDSVEIAYFNALSLFNTGRSADAEREARRALRLDAGAAAAHALLGIILAARGGHDAEASDALTQAVALDASSFDARFYLGRVQYAMQDYANAVKSLRAAVSLDQRNAEARFFLGTALESAGDSEAALTEYQELTRIDPNSAMGQVGLGALLVKQGKIDDAISALKRAISLNAHSFEAHWALGRALILAERFSDAIEPLKVAVTLIPDRADAHYQLGLALKRAGRTEEAAREFAEVERINREFRTRTAPRQ